MGSLKLLVLFLVIWIFQAAQISILTIHHGGLAAYRPAESNSPGEYYREVKSLSGFPILSGHIRLRA